MMAWITRRAGDARTRVVVEGAGSYGAVLCRRLQAARWAVVEAPRLARAEFRGLGKADALDATRIGRAALRVLVVAREEMTAEKTRATNAGTALVRTVDLGIDAAAL